MRQPLRSAIALACCASLLALAGQAVATDKLYKWKDAKGVTHYGDAPPAHGAYEDRTIPQRDQAASATAPAAATTEDPQCESVRANLALLQGDRQLQQDTDGDGTPDRILSQAEREAQVELAEAMLKANCTAQDA